MKPQKIAYIGHSYHTKTRSVLFFTSIFQDCEIVYFEDTFEHDGSSVDVKEIVKEAADVIIVFQVFPIAIKLLKLGFRNILVIPMADTFPLYDKKIWRSLRGARILSFSHRVHSKALNLGLTSLYLQYFPKPPEKDYNKNNALLFRQRSDYPGYSDAERICSECGANEIIYQACQDPKLRLKNIPKENSEIIPSQILGWQERKEDYLKILYKNKFYLVPRKQEGIGISFLEAMSGGCVVFAIDDTIMNEYIIDGYNGILIGKGELSVAKGYNYKEISENAKNYCREGYKNWEKYGKTAARLYVLNYDSSKNITASSIGKVEKESEITFLEKSIIPLSVVVCVLNDAQGFEKTMKSILSQISVDIELIVIDGYSSDETNQLIKNYKNHINIIHKTPPEGPFEAMNFAIKVCQRDYVLYLNAGDTFVYNNVLLDLVPAFNSGKDFIIGSHYYVRNKNRSPILRTSSTIKYIKNRLLYSNEDLDFLRHIPCHQSTISKLCTLKELNGYNWKEFPIAADHDLLFRADDINKTFYTTSVIISNYHGGGISHKNKNQCYHDDLGIISRYSNEDNISKIKLKGLRDGAKKTGLLRNLERCVRNYRKKICK